MAPRYPIKKAKYSYTERVLGAISDIQRDHRKHTIHMATIRAHVRKTANARKDKMGPQWSQWVSRTVQKLVDDGILDNSDPHGNVTFTPNAKKTITAIRRESMGPGSVPSGNMEHKIWKDVTRRFSTVGVKRSRRRSSANGASDDAEEARPRKRQARKSFSGLTKAELEAELRAALRRLDQATEPQALDEDDVEELREELRNREQEVVELRGEVARLRDDHPGERRVTIGTSTRLLTPPPTNPSETTTPECSRAATAPTRFRTSVNAMTRTLSGSLISNLTRRPTPAPSEADSHDARFELMDYDHVPDVMPFPAHPGDGRSAAAPVRETGIETPQSSPMFANREELDPEEPSVNDDDPLEGASHDDEYVTELRQLRDEHQCLLAERDELRGTVVSRDARLAILEADLRSRAGALAASELRGVQLEDTLRSSQQRVREVEAELQVTRQTLDGEKEEHSSLQDKHANLRDVVDNLQNKIQHLTAHTMDLESTLKESRSDVDHWRTAHLESETQLGNLKAEISTIQTELQAGRDSYHDIQVTLEKSEASHAETRAVLKATQADRDALREELAEAHRSIKNGDDAQASMTARINTLEGELKVARERASALSRSNEGLESTVTKLEETVEQLVKEVSHAKGQATSASAALEESQNMIAELKKSHAQALTDASASTREAAALSVTVSELQSTLSKLRSQLEDAAAETAGVRAELDTEQASRRATEFELVATKDERESLVADIAGKTVRVGVLTEELERIRQAADDARRHIASLETQREKDVAAHVTERSALETALETARAEVAELKTGLDGARLEVSRLSGELRAVVAERDGVSVNLNDERVRAAVLEEELRVALDDARDAEEENEGLREAKAADEASIENLKNLLKHLRDVQLEAMDEVSNKVRESGVLSADRNEG
ncbi:hypothetical protein C8Q80DRAFT_1112583 [Daedaleopsis nitida]|nr:hypothetical protein C8Q80DRAFT_1112583 [Daedaleopsis nitida]